MEKNENNQPTCQFNLAWQGACGMPANESGFCEKHEDILCVSCGKQATRECAETMMLVCGAPLCDDCEHTIQDNGCNGGGRLPVGYKAHCRKNKQVYKRWFEKE